MIADPHAGRQQEPEAGGGEGVCNCSFRSGPWLHLGTHVHDSKMAQRICLCWFSASLLTTNQWFLVLLSKRAAEHGSITGKKIPPGPVVTLDQAVRVVSQLLSPQLILQSDCSLQMALFQGRR